MYSSSGGVSSQGQSCVQTPTTVGNKQKEFGGSTWSGSEEEEGEYADQRESHLRKGLNDVVIE